MDHEGVIYDGTKALQIDIKMDLRYGQQKYSADLIYFAKIALLII
jgi:hypothetical protein